MTERTETTRTETVVRDDDEVVEEAPANQMVVDGDTIVLSSSPTRTVQRKTEQPRVETKTETTTRTVDR